MFSANTQASQPRRNRAASVPAVGTPWPLGFAPFLPPGFEARYRWYRRDCPTSRSEDVLGGCQSVDGLPAERPDPLELGRIHTNIQAAASAAAAATAALTAAATRAEADLTNAKRRQSLQRARLEELVKLVAEFRSMEPRFAALLWRPPTPARRQVALGRFEPQQGSARKHARVEEGPWGSDEGWRALCEMMKNQMKGSARKEDPWGTLCEMCEMEEDPLQQLREVTYSMFEGAGT